MIVALNVPDHISFQFVYHLVAKDTVQVDLDHDLEYVFLNSAGQAARQFGAIASYCGKLGALKAIAKLASKHRSFYMLKQAGMVVSAGWCTMGRCKYYKIESDAVVIGPIWTDPKMRGKGLATRALQRVIQEHIVLGRSLFYIDTEKTNLPAQRVFEKCGFGAPVALYFR